MSKRGLHNTPSAIHLAGMIQPTSRGTANEIITTRDSDLISLHQDLKKWMVQALLGRSSDFLHKQASLLPDEKRRQKQVKRAVLEIIPVMADFMSSHDVQWFVPSSSRRIFEFTRTVRVPIAPLGCGLIDRKVRLVFAPTWKNRDLTPQQFRVWSTLVDVGWLSVDPDVEGFTYINMSVAPGSKERVLAVRDDIDATDLLTPLELAWIRRTVDEAMVIVSETPKKKRKAKTKVNSQMELDI